MKKLFLLIILLCLVVLTWANRPAVPIPSANIKIDRIVVEKSKRTLTLFAGTQPVKQYTMALGRVPVGAKEKEGDKKTPEGIYRIVSHKTESAFHRALRLSYPELPDLSRARTAELTPAPTS